MRSSYIQTLIALVIFVTISCVVTTTWMLQQKDLCSIFNKTNESPEQSDLMKEVETITVFAQNINKSSTSSSAKITSPKPTLVYKQMGSYKIPHFKGDPETAVKREKVKEMMLHAWNNYKLYAWSDNELCPIAKNAFFGGVFAGQEFGATILDSLSTLYIMGLTKEFEDARAWVAQNVSFDYVYFDGSVFEANIRLLGGLLSSYALTGDPIFKEKAKHVADILMPAFNTNFGIPTPFINFSNGRRNTHHWTKNSILSEYGTMHLEFSYLSDITGDPDYRDRVEKVRTVLKNSTKPDGLYPNFFNISSGQFGKHEFSLGTFADSFYEYLLKGWIQSGQTNDEERKIFDDAMEAIIKHLVRKSSTGLTYLAMKSNGTLNDKMDHLACFSGGLFALSAHTKKNYLTEKYMELAEEITNTCHEAYIRSATHLGPEFFRFNDLVEAKSQNEDEMFYILRPEVVESYFVMWRITHDQKYRVWGWDVVLALEKYCRVENGFSGIKNVYAENPEYDDIQQSFFLAETLKYLFLLFSDDTLLPLDEWVFNTEAHPLPILGKNLLYRPVNPASFTTIEP